MSRTSINNSIPFLRKAEALILLSAITIVFFSACNNADTQLVTSVVERLCEIDSEGTRLTSDRREEWKAYYSLVTWDWEPGWDQVVVVSSYEVLSPKVHGKTATVDVAYNIVGEHIGREYTAYSSKKEKNKFFLEWNGNEWRITRGRVVPHVSVKAWKQHLEMLISTQSDKNYVDELKSILKKAEAW